MLLLNKIDWEIQLYIQKYLLNVCYVSRPELDTGNMTEVTPAQWNLYYRKNKYET